MKKILSVLLVLVLLVGVLPFSGLIPAASAASKTIYHYNTGTKVYYGGYSTFQCAAEGNPAFCLEPSNSSRRSGNYTATMIEPNSAQNIRLIKCAYYLYGGPGWSGFQATFRKYISGSAYGFTHAIMSYVYCGSTTGVSGYVSAMNNVLNELDKLPLPTGFTVFIYGQGGGSQAYLGWEYELPGNLDIIKTTQNNAGVVSGFKFLVTRQKDGKIIGAYESDATGKIHIPDLEPGFYWVEEIDIPPEFVKPSPNPVSVEVKSGKTATVSFDNVRKLGIVTIIKTGEMLVGANETVGEEIAGETLTLYEPLFDVCYLPGARFDIIARNDIVASDGTVMIPAGTLVTTIVTDSEGKAQSKPLPLGDYYAIEREAPFGMVLDEEKYYFSLKPDEQNEPIVFTQIGVYDERQKVTVSLIKWCDLPKNPPTGFNPYPSIVFGLFARKAIPAYNGNPAIPKDGLLEYIRFDSNGNATVRTDLPFGSYYVKELQTYDGEKWFYYLDDTEYDFDFEYAGQDVAVVEIVVKDGEPIENWLGGILVISKEFPTASLKFEHATGAGVIMPVSGGQQWEEYMPIRVGAVKDGSFIADIVVEQQKYKVGNVTAEFMENGDLKIIYTCLSGYHLQQGARLDIVDDPSKFTSKARGDLKILSDNQNYAGATEGYITISAAILADRGIDFNDDDQEFYVFLRLDRVAGGIHTNENRSWIDSDYTYEFMIFSEDDLILAGYKTKNDRENAIKTDIVGVLEKVKPIETVKVGPKESVEVVLPTDASGRRYLVAEIFRYSCGCVINNHDAFLSHDNDIDTTKLINVGDKTKESSKTKLTVKNDFKIFYDQFPPASPYCCDEHDWGEWTVTTPAQCLASGEETRVCKSAGCPHTEIRTIPALGHDMVSWTVVTPAQCMWLDGVETSVCQRAGCTHSVTRAIPAADHDWNAWTVTVPAQCQVPGAETRICKNDSSHVETREIPALDHVWGEWEVDIAATCTEDGTEIRVCTLNHEHTETRDIDPTGHNMGPCVEDEEHDHEEGTRECNNDGCDYSETGIGVWGHNWSDDQNNWITIADPDCEETGLAHQCCTRCDQYRERILEATDHDWTGEWEQVTDPSTSPDGIGKDVLVCLNNPAHFQERITYAP